MYYEKFIIDDSLSDELYRERNFGGDYKNRSKLIKVEKGIYLRGDYFYIKHMYKGKCFQQSAKTTLFKEAKNIYNKMKEDLRNSIS